MVKKSFWKRGEDVFNPMGIVISYLQGDRATVTGDQ